MPETELKLFSEFSEDMKNPVIIRSIDLPLFARPDILSGGVYSVLKRLGYDMSTEGCANRDRPFIKRESSSWYHSIKWDSLGLHVYYDKREHPLSGGISAVGYTIRASKRRREEALKIARELEHRVTEAVKEYLKYFKDESERKNFLKGFPALRDAGIV